MILTIAAILAAFTVGPRTDTTFSVPRGTRLEVHNFGGPIEVRVWGKDAIRIEAEPSDRARVSIERTGSTIEVRSRSHRGIPPEVSYRIQVPVWMALDLSGVNTSVSVEGTKADVSAETVQGDVDVVGGDGYVKLSSVQGTVRLGRAKGRIELSSINSAVDVSDVDGEVSVEAVNGDVRMERILARLVEAETVSGTVTYLGSILDNGRYRLASHQGDLILALPERANAKVSVATFNGDFDSSFPVSIDRSNRGRRFTFTMGSGSAVVDLETFAGSIRLARLKDLLGTKSKDSKFEWKTKDEKDKDPEDK